MRISQLLIRGLGVFEELKLDFPRGTDPDRADAYLFIGPNGSGKSTLLYGLASAVGGLNMMPQDLVRRRWRTNDARVEVSADGDLAAIARIGARPPDQIPSLLRPGTPLRRTNSAVEMGRFFGDPTGPLATYEERAAQGREAVSFAAFAYAGASVVQEFKLRAIEELTRPPMHNSLGFQSAGDATFLAQWLALMSSKEAFALRDGRAALADAYAESVRRVERAISGLLGEELKFTIGYEPLSVVVEQGGRQVALDQLPDGLKSIILWLADLLMRLDRLHWVDDLPIVEREILLILDEVDIFLHPALQRRLLPVLQRLLPKAQIIMSTHSPLVVTSATDAWVYGLERQGEAARLGFKRAAELGSSYVSVIKELFAVREEFSFDTEAELAEFYVLRQQVLRGHPDQLPALVAKANLLANRGVEVRDIVMRELRQVERALAGGQPPA